MLEPCRWMQFYSAMLSTEHGEAAAGSGSVYATLSSRKRWLTDRQALAILRV